MELLLKLLFHHANFNISCINKNCNLAFTQNIKSFLEKSSLQIKRNFLLSGKDFSDFQDILGDSYLYLSKELTFNEFKIWLNYHHSLYCNWKGKIFDCQWSYSQHEVEGGLGHLIYSMMYKSVPMPIDILVLHIKDHEYSDYLPVVLERFDSSVYDPVYSGNLEGIQYLFDEFKDFHSIRIVGKEPIPVPSNCPEDLKARLEKINSGENKPKRARGTWK